MTLILKSNPIKHIKLSLIPCIIVIMLLSGCGETTKSQAPHLSSTISYELSEKKTISVTLYDVFGNEAYTTHNSDTKKGTNTFTLSSSDISSASTSNSIYLYVIKDTNGNLIKNGKTWFN